MDWDPASWQGSVQRALPWPPRTLTGGPPRIPSPHCPQRKLSDPGCILFRSFRPGDGLKALAFPMEKRFQGSRGTSPRTQQRMFPLSIAHPRAVPTSGPGGAKGQPPRSGVRSTVRPNPEPSVRHRRGSVLECVQRQLPPSPAPPRHRSPHRLTDSTRREGRSSVHRKGSGTSTVCVRPATKAAADAARTPGRSAPFVDRGAKGTAGDLRDLQARDRGRPRPPVSGSRRSSLQASSGAS